MKGEILIVDDQMSFCHHLQGILEKEGYDAKISHDAEQALEKLSRYPFDVMLIDMKLPGIDGLKLFQLARQTDPDISGIMMTAYGSISSAVAAIKMGISDYLQKPFEPETLLMVIEKTFRERDLYRQLHNLRKEINERYSFGNLIGKSRKMQHIYDLIKRVAPTDARVLITGETGVGKELVAKAIHYNSNRSEKPFVGINCGALTDTLLESELFGYERGAFTGAVRTKKGKFEYAQGGTLFLDEIGDISPNMQVKLLRVLQENTIERVGGNISIPVDVRIISATNQDIDEKIRRGEFRLELYYRLNVVPIRIPPLRERTEDIPLLVKHFVDKFNKKMGKDIKEISPRAMAQLMSYHWPGNVRELENILERAVVISEGDTIDQLLFPRPVEWKGDSTTLEDGALEMPFHLARDMALKRFEKTYIFEALKRCKGNVAKAAKQTGMSSRTLWRKMKNYGFNRDQFKRAAEV